MSLFGDIDVDSVPDDPFSVPDGTYEAYVTEAEVKPNKAGDKTGLWLTYTISDDKFEGMSIKEWKTIPTYADPKNPTQQETRDAASLKQRILSLGFEPDEVVTAAPSEMVGRAVVITVRKRNEYTNVTKVVPGSVSDNDIDIPF